MSDNNTTIMPVSQRIDRNSFFYFNQIFDSIKAGELSIEVLFFANYLAQNKQCNLFGELEFTIKDFLDYTKRTRSSIYWNSDEYKTVNVPTYRNDVLESLPLKNGLEYVLYMFSRVVFDTSKVYQRSGKTLYEFSASTLLNFTVQVGSRSKRMYLIKLNPLLMDSVLNQYAFVAADELFSLRGRKKNSVYPLACELLKLSLSVNYKENLNDRIIKLYYPRIKALSGVNINGYENHENISRTKNKIVGYLKLIKQKMPSVEFDYSINDDNSFSFVFAKKKKEFTSNDKLSLSIFNTLNSIKVAFLKKLEIKSIKDMKKEDFNLLVKQLILSVASASYFSENALNDLTGMVCSVMEGRADEGAVFNAIRDLRAKA